MGSTITTPKQKLPPDELHIFKGSNDVEHSIPEIGEKRKQTDRIFLMIMITLLLLWIPLLAYSLSNADIKRLTHGFDHCGNVCGEENSKIEDISCSGKDMSNKPFLLYDNELHDKHKLDSFEVFIRPRHTVKTCVSKCKSPSYWNILNRCFKKVDLNDGFNLGEIKDENNLLVLKQILNDLYKSTGHIIGMTFIALGLCFLFLILFRFFLGVVIWFVIGCSTFLCIIICWYAWKQYNADLTDIVTPLVLTFFTIFIVIFILKSYKKIQLVVKVFQLTSRALFDIPTVMLVPIVVFLVLSLWLAFFIWIYTYLITAGKLVRIGMDHYIYVANGMMHFSLFYTLIMTIYVGFFVHGSQRVTVAGAISTWYFARDKKILGSPVLDSFRNLRKYHLGSVAFGALVITIVKIIRFIIQLLSKNSKLKLCIDCCISFIDSFIHYLSNQAYIMIAMHGQPFLDSGKRASRLLWQNPLNTLAVNTLGDFILFLTKLMIFFLTILSGVMLDDGNIEYYAFAIVIGGFIAAVLADSTFNNFEICVDTIFLCYCEDSSINDGIERPYFATPDLIEAVNHANEMIETQKLYSEPPPQSYV